MSGMPCSYCGNTEADPDKDAQEIAELRAKLAAAEKDAERYRWLRRANVHNLRRCCRSDNMLLAGDGLDRNVDAAIAKEKE